MDPVLLYYKGTVENYSMNIIAGFKDKAGTLTLIREGLNNSVYIVKSPDSLDLHYGIEASTKLTKKASHVEGGEKFKFKTKTYTKLTRAELVKFFADKTFIPVKGL